MRNPRLDAVPPYVPDRLRSLLAKRTPPADVEPIVLSIGEPRHPTPPFITQALSEDAAALGTYPDVRGGAALRRSIAAALTKRFGLTGLDPETQVAPCNGSREAVFSLAQAVVDSVGKAPVIVCPNPLYPIYEGAARLAGATPHFVGALAEEGFRIPFETVADSVWERTQLIYVCSPNNPTGRVWRLEEWGRLFALADRFDFVIAADECYADIYPDEGAPPLGALEAATRLGRASFSRLVSMGSLSKRSSAPGLRSGYIAGDRDVLREFLHYRTYNGSAMGPAVQRASEHAWRDEAHVAANRALYREKLHAFRDIVSPVWPVTLPEAAFYVWLETPIADEEFVGRLFAEEHVTVLPGSFLGRGEGRNNPGFGRVRVSLTASAADCAEAARRIASLLRRLP